jgi:hypothetical protein
MCNVHFKIEGAHAPKCAKTHSRRFCFTFLSCGLLDSQLFPSSLPFVVDGVKKREDFVLSVDFLAAYDF